MWDQRVSIWLLVCTARLRRTCWGRPAPSLSELWPTMTSPWSGPPNSCCKRQVMLPLDTCGNKPNSREPRFAVADCIACSTSRACCTLAYLNAWVTCTACQDASHQCLRLLSMPGCNCKGHATCSASISVPLVLTVYQPG